MNYTNLYDDFINMFPDDKRFFKCKENELLMDKDDGMHVMFASVVCPFLHKIVDEKNDDKIRNAFDFIEQMETCGDDDIANVADVSVIEIIMTDENGGLPKFKQYLGPKTMESVNYMSRFFDFQE